MSKHLTCLAAGLFFFAAVSSIAQISTSPDYQKGMAAYNLGNFEEALQDFQNVINDKPDSWDAYEQAGYCYFHLGRSDEMKAAFDESLSLHKDNPELTAFIKSLSKSPTTPSITPTASMTTLTKDVKNNEPSGGWDTAPWLKISGALDFGTMGDLSNAANVWNQELAQYRDLGSGSFSNVGYFINLEGGLPLDKTNALSLQVGFETGEDLQENLVYSSPITENVSAKLLVVGLNYYHYFPDSNGRFLITAGALVGVALVNYYQDDPTETLSGGLTGDSLGFNLGVGREWKLSPTLGLEISGRFRYLSITQIQNNYMVSGFPNTGQVVLAVDTAGDVGLTTPQNIGQGGLRYAVLDYTCFNLGFAFNFYLF